jgi:hypothetical protein
MKVHDAVLLQEKLLNMSSQVINVSNEDGSHQEKLVGIQWPAIVTMIHQNDTYGEHFPTR